jgi:murein DD-endopeptidase MepM/ murein hydrolase activator NlpD
MVAAFAVAPTSSDLRASQHTIVESLRLDPVDLAEPRPHVFVREESVQRGDSIASVLSRMGIDDDDAVTFLRQDKAARPFFRQLRPGKWISAQTKADGSLVSLVFPVGGEEAIFVESNGTSFSVTQKSLKTDTQVLMSSAEIKSSLFAATDDAGLPDSVATQLAEIFGSEVDFHRDLRRGDRLSVVYEMVYHEGRPLRGGRVLCAEFVNGGHTYRAVYFQSVDGKGAYYSPQGKSLRKAFLRSPLEFSRITSGFSMRLHPILNEWRAHKGVDYAAPTGTRVKATADGAVDFVGVQRGYGNVVILRHQGKYTTYYGHLKGFASGVRKGMRVAQGDTIGYVGMTGMATGPHLHYEFRINDIQQNPLAGSMPIQIPLSNIQLADFKLTTGPLLARLELVKHDTVAMFD